MGKLSIISLLSLSIILTLPGNRAEALPGQLTETVGAWINANPTLRPSLGDGLTVRKNNTAAQTFTFQASIIPPGKLTTPGRRDIIRTERFSFFDMINGVTPERLKESLRVIYGLGIYQDYDRAKIVYDYPSPETASLARRQNLPILEARQGELRVGERYAYWIEVTQTDQGKAFNGQMTILLIEDLDKLETELRDR